MPMKVAKKFLAVGVSACLVAGTFTGALAVTAAGLGSLVPLAAAGQRRRPSERLPELSLPSARDEGVASAAFLLAMSGSCARRPAQGFPMHRNPDVTE